MYGLFFGLKWSRWAQRSFTFYFIMWKKFLKSRKIEIKIDYTESEIWWWSTSAANSYKAFCNKYQMGFNYISWYILEKIVNTDCWRYNPYHLSQFSCISVGFLRRKSQFIFSLIQSCTGRILKADSKPRATTTTVTPNDLYWIKMGPT